MSEQQELRVFLIKPKDPCSPAFGGYPQIRKMVVVAPGRNEALRLAADTMAFRHQDHPPSAPAPKRAAEPPSCPWDDTGLVDCEPLPIGAGADVVAMECVHTTIEFS